EVRRVKPLLLIRGLTPEAARRWHWRAIDWTSVLTAVAVSIALVALASWQAASLRGGLRVSVGFAGVALILPLAGIGLVRAVKPLATASWFPLRHAVNGLRRPGNQTRVILLAVGLGSFFVIGIRALESNLLSQFSFQLQRSGADMFLIDIQEDQVPGVQKFLGARATPSTLIPVLRARVTAVKGRDVNLDTYQDVRGRGSLAREYTITYRDHLEANERLLQGRFWTGEPPLAADASLLEVSIEKSIHERFRINVGDEMRFDILGRT